MQRLPIVFGMVLSTGGLPAQSDSLPPMSQRVVAFVREHVGSRVGRGECWDLAARALEAAGARWDGDYGFGREVDPSKEAILPGYVVQFEGVEFRWEEGRAIHTISMPHHTAIIIEVKDPGSFIIGQQNTRETGRKVGVGELVLSRRVRGRIGFYAPVE